VEVFVRPISFVCLASLLLVPSALADHATRVSDLQRHPFAETFPSAGRIRADIRSADIEFTGHEDNRITVRVDGSSERLSEVTLRYERSGDTADLHVDGGPNNDVHINIEVPRISNLQVRVPAGDVEIRGITGDKDVDLHAGDLDIEVGNPADYAHVSASVLSGDISAGVFGEDHSGLFRSFTKKGNGRYNLRVHLLAGDITLH
jgi:hypothetical protein